MRLRVNSVAVMALALAVALGGCAARRESPEPSTTAPSEEPAPTVDVVPSPETPPLLGYVLPTDVASLQSSLGAPDSIERPPADDPSPWGQWLEWTLADGSTFRALCDDYSPDTTDSAASVRVIEQRAVPETAGGLGAETPTILGFVLNRSTLEEVRDALPGSEPNSWHDRGELDPDDVYRDTIRYEYGGRYTYFFFGDSDLLVGVVQASFAADGAD